MAKKEYTQTVKPVSRIAERIFGWLAWAGLLVIAGFILFFTLVTINDQEFINQFRTQMMSQLEGQNLEGVSPEQMVDAAIDFMNNSWIAALYFALPLILGLFGLLTMRRRILAGFLMLLAGVFSAPLILGVITGLIPLFFVVSAILLFVRKDIVMTGDDGLRDRPEDAGAGRERDFERNREMEYEREVEESPRETSSDMDETQRFNRLEDEDIRDYENETKERYVDDNIDSDDSFEPVTDEEYERSYGKEDGDDDYSYGDATKERRDNVNRRNIR